jgi:UDP-N-acetylmuramyl tripeptide synthase
LPAAATTTTPLNQSFSTARSRGSCVKLLGVAECSETSSTVATLAAVSARLAVETFAARAAAGLSRVAGAGGGTTLPGKLLWKLDPGAIDALAARLPQGSVVVSATNGKTTATAMAAEILEGRWRLAWNRSGANLVSGVASTLLAQRDAELGLLEVDEGALPEVARRVRPKAVLLGNLFRDQLDRYGELEHIAERWRAATGALPPDTVLVVNGDDPQVGDLAHDRPGSVAYGIDDPRHARPALQHAADSRYCIRCGTPYEFAAAYVGHLGDYRCPGCGHERPALQVRATEIELEGLEAAAFTLETPQGSIRVRLPLPGLYNVYNALGAAALAQALGVPLTEIRAGLERFGAAFGRFERIQAEGRTLLILLIKNPAGANEVVHTLLEANPPTLLLVALNDAIADGKDVSWIWDVDFEPLLAVTGRLIASGDRAAELGVRCVYGGLAESGLEVEPDLERALDRGLELTPAGGELVVLPTYTAMLELQRIVTDRGLVKPYWARS